MRPCTSSWSFAACSLKEAVAISKALGIRAVDIGYFHGPALDKRRVLSVPESYAEEVKRLDFEIPTFYHLFGENLVDRNLADTSHLAANVEDFKQVVKFCQVAGIPVVFIIPGVTNPGQSREQALEQSCRSLKALLPIAEEAGIVLSIEAHVHSYLESPRMVIALLEAVPGIKLTLDYSHFICLGYPQEEIDPLAPYAAHVHLRQARPGALQTKMEEGTLNFFALFGLLKKLNYKGYIAFEAVHQNYMNTIFDDVLTEIVKMRDAYFEFMGQSLPKKVVNRY